MTGLRSHVEGLAAKLIELAREIVPGASRLGVLVNTTGLGSPTAEILAQIPKVGAALVSGEVRDSSDLEFAFQRFTMGDDLPLVRRLARRRVL